MTYPLYTIARQEQVYKTVMEDGAIEFILRIQPYFNTSVVQYEKNDIYYTDIKSERFCNLLTRFITSSFASKSFVMCITHNEASDDVRIAMSKLLSQDDRTLLNYLLLLNNLATTGFSCDMLDLVRLDNEQLYKDLPMSRRIEKMLEFINTPQVLVYSDDVDSMYMQVPIYKRVMKNDLAQLIGSWLEEYGSLYYRMEIYGNNSYALYNPLISEIHDKTGINLAKPQLLNPEYNALARQLGQL